MNSAKQNIKRQSIDNHRITLIESKQRFTYYSLVLNRERAVQTTAIKKTGPREASATKLDPASK